MTTFTMPASLETAMSDPLPETALAIPVAPDDRLYEVVNGQVVEVPAGSAYSSWVGSQLSFLLGPFTKSRGLGTTVTEMLFILDTEGKLRRRPDVAFVSAERWPLDRPMPLTGDWRVAPNLAIEVLSPSDPMQGQQEKLRDYFSHGVEEVWIVSPCVRIAQVYKSETNVQVLTESEALEGGRLLPGFRCSLKELFGPPPEVPFSVPSDE